MSEVAYSNAYASQAAYQQSSVDLNKTQGAGDLYTGSAYQGGALQSSVDSALVEALLQVLVGLAQNQGLPKYKLNEIIDFLKNFLSNGGSVGAGNGAADGSGNSSGGVHLTAGDQIEAGGKTVIAADPNMLYPAVINPNVIYLQPGQNVTVDGVKISYDARPENTWQPSYPQLPVMTQPVVSQPAPAQTQPSATVSIAPSEFQARYTVPTLMNDGSWVPTTNSVALQAFGIPVGTPMSQVDLNNLTPRPGAEGTVIAPVSRSLTPATNTPAQTAANAGLQEAGALLTKINSGTATKEDVQAFLSKLAQVAQSFAEAVGDSAASQSGARKAKKGVGAAVEGGVSGGNGSASGGSGSTAASGPKGFFASEGAAAVGNAEATSVPSASANISSNYNPSEGIAPGFSGSVSGKSWLMAIAEAMGNVLGSKVQQMLTSSSRMGSLTNDSKAIGAQSDAVNQQLKNFVDGQKGKTEFDTKGYEDLKAQLKPQQDIIDNAMKANGQEFTVESSKLQGASQEFSMLQNAFSNAIKSIGEGLGQLARKG